MQAWNYNKVGDIAVSESTQRTVIAMTLHAIFRGLNQQMAKSAEEISSSNTAATSCLQPSDDVAMHRLCGWALFSVINHLKTQVKKSNKPSCVEQLSFANSLKLASNDKHSLPSPIQYLDRGGMTFLRKELWPWMQKVEQKMAQHLNGNSYRQYGSRLFEVVHV